MNPTRHIKTVQVGNHAFTISGERDAGGPLRFTVDDIDCALPEPGDEIAQRFQAAVKQRLANIRRQRDAA